MRLSIFLYIEPFKIKPIKLSSLLHASPLAFSMCYIRFLSMPGHVMRVVKILER